MSADITNHILRRQYLAHKGEDLLSQVHRIVCLVTPNSFISAGFHPSGEVLIINSSLLDSAHWNAHFIEYEFVNDTLLAAPEMIQNVFLAPTKSVLIPKEVYKDEANAGQWLSKIFHCEADEQINVVAVEKNELHIAFSFPQSIAKIFEQYTADLSILPLQLNHFKNSVAVDNLMQCTIMDNYALATLHHHKKLQWQQCFEYQNAEDIVYQLTAACKMVGVDVHSFPLYVNTTNVEQHIVLKKVRQYLPNIEPVKSGIADIISPEWSSTIQLFQQLYSCVS
jgi:hypothetical protein